MPPQEQILPNEHQSQISIDLLINQALSVYNIWLDEKITYITVKRLFVETCDLRRDFSLTYQKDMEEHLTKDCKQ